MPITTYHPGGFQSSAPAQNRAVEIAAGGLTRWDTAGGVVEQRALTAEETGLLAAQDATVTALVSRGQYESQAEQAIDTLESAWTNWGALTAAQKDAALKLTVRVVTRLARLVLGRLV